MYGERVVDVDGLQSCGYLSHMDAIRHPRLAQGRQLAESM